MDTRKKGGNKVEKPAKGINRNLRDVLGGDAGKQQERAEELKVGVRTIQEWDAEDRARDCATHVYSSKTEKIEYLKPNGWRTTEYLYTRRCRYCGYEPPQMRTFMHLGPAVQHPSNVSSLESPPRTAPL